MRLRLIALLPPIAMFRLNFLTWYFLGAQRKKLQDGIHLPQLQTFLINNFDLILTIFHERQLPKQETAPFEDALKQQVALLIEAQFASYYADMINFVRAHEQRATNTGESGADGGGAGGPAPTPSQEDVLKITKLRTICCTPFCLRLHITGEDKNPGRESIGETMSHLFGAMWGAGRD